MFKVGDRVKYSEGDTLVRDIIHIHSKDQRIFYVVAYKGDIPSVYQEEDMKKFTVVSTTQGTLFINGEAMTVNVDTTNGKPDLSTLRFL